MPLAALVIGAAACGGGGGDEPAADQPEVTTTASVAPTTTTAPATPVVAEEIGAPTGVLGSVPTAEYTVDDAGLNRYSELAAGGGLVWVSLDGSDGASSLLSLDPATGATSVVATFDRAARIAVGTTAIWVDTDDTVARVDIASGEVTPLEEGLFWPTAGYGQVWARDRNRAVRLDPLTGVVIGEVSISGSQLITIFPEADIDEAGSFSFTGVLAVAPDRLWIADRAVVEVDPETGEALLVTSLDG